MSRPGSFDDRSFFDDSSFPVSSPYADDNPFAPSQPQPVAAPVPAAGRGGGSTPLIVAIVAVSVVLLLLIGVAVGMMMNRDDGSAYASGGAGGDGGVTPVAEPTSVADDDVTTEAEVEPARETTTVFETTTAQETTRSRSSSRDDLGTGRSDVDERGWIGRYTRCDQGDDALAVLRTHDRAGNLTLAVACEAPDGYKYYRGLNGSNSIEMPVIVDEGDRIVAQNGSWKYQMSPSSLIITENNVVEHNMPAEVWGQR